VTSGFEFRLSLWVVHGQAVVTASCITWG